MYTISLVYTVFGVVWALAHTPMMLCFGVHTNDFVILWGIWFSKCFLYTPMIGGDSLVYMVFCVSYNMHQ